MLITVGTASDATSFFIGVCVIFVYCFSAALKIFALSACILSSPKLKLFGSFYFRFFSFFLGAFKNFFAFLRFFVYKH